MGFYDPTWSISDRIAQLEKKLADLSVEDLWQPIVSCSTTDRVEIDLRFADGSTKAGYFSSSEGRWIVKTDIGYGPLEFTYPTHWRVKRLHKTAE